MTDRVRAYSYLYPGPNHPIPAFWGDADMAAESAADLVARGYTAVKFDPAGPYTIRGGHMPAMHDIAASVAFCRKIREAVGDRADLLFGTHGQFSVPGAIRMGQAIEPYLPLWYEEPVPPDNPEALAEVARAVRIPVAAGERLTTRADFAAVLKAGPVRILQPALGRAGGLWEARKIAVLAESYGAEVAPHLYAGPVEWAANVHLAARASGSRWTRRWRARIPSRATGCTCRCRRRPTPTGRARSSRAARRGSDYCAASSRGGASVASVTEDSASAAAPWAQSMSPQAWTSMGGRGRPVPRTRFSISASVSAA